MAEGDEERSAHEAWKLAPGPSPAFLCCPMGVRAGVDCTWERSDYNIKRISRAADSSTVHAAAPELSRPRATTVIHSNHLPQIPG